MATLSAHKGVEAIYRDRGGFRYAICKDDKVLVRGTVSGWSVTGYGPDFIRSQVEKGALQIEPADQAVVDRANAASHSREGAKAIRRIKRSR